MGHFGPISILCDLEKKEIKNSSLENIRENINLQTQTLQKGEHAVRTKGLPFRTKLFRDFSWLPFRTKELPFRTNENDLPFRTNDLPFRTKDY